MVDYTSYITLLVQSFTGILLIGILCVAIYFMVIRLKFKHLVTILEVGSDGKVNIEEKDKAAIVKDKDGVVFWKLLKTRKKLAEPPRECIRVTPKGKKAVHVLKLSENDYQYDFHAGVQYKDGKLELKGHNPITTNQRIMATSEMKKAIERKHMTWKDYVVPLAGIGALVIISVSLMLFYADMAKPLLEMGDKQVAIAESQEEATRMLQEIIQEKQYVTGEVRVPE